MRSAILPALGVIGLVLLVVVRVEPPSDLGSWADGPLPGQIVAGLHADGTGLLVAARSGLHRVAADGTTSSLGVAGPVHAVAATEAGDIWAGTDDGAVLLRPATAGPPTAEAATAEPATTLAGTAVRSLDADGTTVLAGSDTGIHRLVAAGDWQRVWPTDAGADTPVGAVLGTSRGILFAHPEGLALLTTEGAVDVVVPDVDVVALGQWSQDGSVWAGLRAGPLLLRSADGGATWTPRSEGLGYNAVHDVAADPIAADHLVAGGAGLADGEGNAGTQVTRDGGTSWTAEQDRLTNTHVYALESRTERVRLSLRVAGTDADVTVPLPTTSTRWYAGTNGSGISTLSTPVPALEQLAAATPYLRLAEPVLGGMLLLVVLVPAYRHLARSRVRNPRAPPVQPGPVRTDPPPTHQSTTTYTPGER